jgi:hypothetical protein
MGEHVDFRQKAISDFYREEFLLHMEQLQDSGIVHDGNREVMNRTCEKLISDIDRVCTRAEFRGIAETLLQNFDTLTRLSQQGTRKAH